MDTRGKGAVESMRYVRMLGLCLVAVFALGAFMAAGASAKLPEWGKCEAHEHGKYTDAGCTVKAHGKGHGEERVYEGAYEWTPRETVFAGEIMEGETTTVTFETQAGVKIECARMQSESSLEGFGNGAKTPLWLLEECSSEGQPCSTLSIGSEIGNISNALAWFQEEGRGWTGNLGFIEGKGTESPVVGLSYTAKNKETGEPEPITASGVAIECEGSTGTVLIGGERHGGNAFIGTIGPLNTTVKEFTVTYAESAPGIQSAERFVHKKPQYLQAFLHNHWERVAITSTMAFHTAKLEIKATK